MATLEVPEAVHDQISLLAKAWGISKGAAVERLLDEFRRPREAAAGPEGVPVHAVYQGKRVEGRFVPATERLTITTGELSNQTFRSPTGAAIALVRSSNPHINPNRNGWTFWTVTATERPLQSIRLPVG
nr:hypothetical protein [Micromonospora sp. DSM 115978]